MEIKRLIVRVAGTGSMQVLSLTLALIHIDLDLLLRKLNTTVFVLRSFLSCFVSLFASCFTKMKTCRGSNAHEFNFSQSAAKRMSGGSFNDEKITKNGRVFGG